MDQPQITVQVRLFATLRRHVPNLEVGEALSIRLSEGSTIRRLLDRLHLPDEDVKVVFVNGVVQKKEHRLSEGDEIGIFPPVGGG